MIGTTLAVGTVNGRNAAALIVDGTLDDLLVDPTDATPVQGTIYRAVADRPAKGMGGQFVRLAGGLKGFLRQGQIPGGRTALVQVTGFAEPGKAIPVTTKLLFKGRNVIVTPGAQGINISRQIHDDDRTGALKELVAEACPDVTGAILRSAAEHADDDTIAQELKSLHALATAVTSDTGDQPELLLDGPTAADVAWMEWDHDGSEPASFADFDVDEMIDDMRQPFSQLDGGASVYVEPTRALVAVDVNTGGDTSPAAGLKANISLSHDLPRLLRCKGLGGQIVIDFAPFPKKDRKVLEQVLRAAFKGGSVETALVGWTPLGHFELNRKRARLPLA